MLTYLDKVSAGSEQGLPEIILGASKATALLVFMKHTAVDVVSVVDVL